MNVVTKSGTNDWHGGAWEFNRDDALQAQNFFATTKPALKQNQFGGAIGGPVVKNRAFVFGYYEGFKNQQGITDTRTVLSAAQRAGDFSGGAAIRDPLTGAAFPGNVIPANRIDPIAAKILDSYIPLPNSSANRVVRSPDVRGHARAVRHAPGLPAQRSPQRSSAGISVGHTEQHQSARRIQLLAGRQHRDRDAAGRDGLGHVDDPADDDQRRARVGQPHLGASRP